MMTARSKGNARKVLVRTLREQVAAHIRHDVLSGQLAVGDPLREVELAERFGVSRGPVRDALLQLTQEGWLVLHPHCGAKVAEPAGAALRPLVIALRRAVEGYALRLFFADIGPDDYERWDDILDRMRAACARGDLPAIAEQDLILHQSLIARAGLPELLELWLPLVARVRFAYPKYYNDLSEIHQRHRAIIDTFRGGDVDAAVRALEANIS